MKEKSTWTIQRSILLLVLIVVDAFLIFFQPDCGIDKEFLSCVFSGTLGDWLGIILLHLCVFAMMGFIKPLMNLVSPEGSTSGNYIIGAATLASILLILFT